MKWILILFFSIIHSEVTNDSLSVLIKEEVAKILNEVTYIDPLKDKIGGIEINPLYTLVYSQGSGISFAGTVSFFPKKQKAEIAFPFAYMSFDDCNECISWDNIKATFRLDAQYRYFLGKHRKGVHFISGFRYAKFNDYTNQEDSNSDYYGDGGDSINVENTINKFGISFGAGYRIFSRSGLYWGTSFYIGKYMSEGMYMNFEFFKIGMTF